MKRQKEWALEFSIRRIGIVIKKKKSCLREGRSEDNLFDVRNSIVRTKKASVVAVHGCEQPEHLRPGLARRKSLANIC